MPGFNPKLHKHLQHLKVHTVNAITEISYQELAARRAGNETLGDQLYEQRYAANDLLDELEEASRQNLLAPGSIEQVIDELRGAIGDLTRAKAMLANVNKALEAARKVVGVLTDVLRFLPIVP